MDITTLLTRYGFSDKEAKVYIALLQCRQASASTIARQIGDKRLSTYSVLQELVKQGLVSSYDRQGTAWYTPLNPSLFIQQQKETLTQQTEGLEVLAQGLDALVQSKSSPSQLEHFHGLAGLQACYMDMLSSEEVYGIVGRSPDKDPALTKRLYEEYLGRRFQHHKTIHMIYHGSSHQVYDTRSKSQDTTGVDYDYRLYEDEDFDLRNGIFLHHGDKVTIMTYTRNHLSAVVHTDASLYQSMCSLFRIIWKISKKD